MECGWVYAQLNLGSKMGIFGLTMPCEVSPMSKTDNRKVSPEADILSPPQRAARSSSSATMRETPSLRRV